MNQSIHRKLKIIAMLIVLTGITTIPNAQAAITSIDDCDYVGDGDFTASGTWTDSSGTVYLSWDDDAGSHGPIDMGPLIDSGLGQWAAAKSVQVDGDVTFAEVTGNGHQETCDGTS